MDQQSSKASQASPSQDGSVQSDSDGGSRSEGVLAVPQVVSLVLGQLGAVTALAFYFGWVRTDAFLQYFGLDNSVVSLATTDYVLRSVGSAYWPLMLLGIFVAAALAIHPAIYQALDSRPSTRSHWLTGAAVVGVLMLVTAVAGLYQVWIFPRSVPVIPLLITGGFALITYSGDLHSRWRTSRRDIRGKAQFLALSGLIAGGLFWSLGSYAAEHGVAAAREVDETLAHEADVTVFSIHRLGLNGTGLISDPIGDGESLYRFRYTGLRMLLRSDDRYFLLPKQWRRGEDPVIVLSESHDVRLQFVAPP